VHLLGTISDVDVSTAIAVEPPDLQRMLQSIFADSGVRGTGVAEGLIGTEAVNQVVKCTMSEKVLPLAKKVLPLASVGGATLQVQAEGLTAGIMPGENGTAYCAPDAGDVPPSLEAQTLEGSCQSPVQVIQESIASERGDAEQNWEELLSDHLLKRGDVQNKSDGDTIPVVVSLEGLDSVSAELTHGDSSVLASALHAAVEIAKTLRERAAPLAPALAACLVRMEDSSLFELLATVLSSIGAPALQRYRMLFPGAFSATPSDARVTFALCSTYGGDHSDAVLGGLVALLPETLREVSLDFRSNIGFTDVGLVSLANFLPQGLRELRLDLRCNPHFTDAGVGQLAEKLPPCLIVLALDLRGSEKISDVGLAALGDGLPRSLVELHLCLFWKPKHYRSRPLEPCMASARPDDSPCH